MLQAYATEKKVGVEFVGDYYDLKSMYNVFDFASRKLDIHNEHDYSTYRLLQDFMYIIKDSLEGNSIIKEMDFEDAPKYPYFGFRLTWVNILFYIAAIRQVFSYNRTNYQSQSFAYLFEGLSFHAAKKINNAEFTESFTHYIDNPIRITDPYSYIISEQINYEFIKKKTAVNKFRILSSVLESYFNERSSTRVVLIKALKQECIGTSIDPYRFDLIRNIEIDW